MIASRFDTAAAREPPIAKLAVGGFRALPISLMSSGRAISLPSLGRHSSDKGHRVMTRIFQRVLVLVGVFLAMSIGAAAAQSRLPRTIASAGVTLNEWEAIRTEARQHARRAGALVSASWTGRAWGL